MVIAIVSAALFGCGQFILDILVFNAVFSSKAGKAVVSVFSKLILYGAGFSLLYFCFSQFIKAAAIGFAVGFFPTLILYGIYRIIKEQPPYQK